MILKDFLKNSGASLQILVNDLKRFRGNKERKIYLSKMAQNSVKDIVLDGDFYFLRSSVEYSNPQLTVEEVQGIIAARLLEVCGNYHHLYGVSEIGEDDFSEICNLLEDPPQGKIISFLLNTDDVEPDRYSMNPLKESIVQSGQSALPSAFVTTENLSVDENFMKKYDGSLISKFESNLIEYHLGNNRNSYMDFVDSVKYEHLEILSQSFRINLCLPMMRMPITVLKKEKTNGLLHYVIKETHKNYDSIEGVYDCMGRSMKKRKTLLTVPFSKYGFGSKRAARGKIYFKDKKLKSVRVTYKTTPLYPNAIDPDDISIAEAEDQFIVEGERFVNYDFHETPSSPQFILYSLASPEDAVLWHGIGAFASSQLVKSYSTTRIACSRGSMFNNLNKYGVRNKIPSQFNLFPDDIWIHPIHRNIDASIGCIDNLEDLAKRGMRLETLFTSDYTRF
jgi:hypothetical protein